MKTSLLFLMIVSCLCGCQPQGKTRIDNNNADAWSQWEEQQRRVEIQMERHEKGLTRGEELMDRQEEQSRRYTRLLTKWEEQAQRFDAVLDAMEKQHGIKK